MALREDITLADLYKFKKELETNLTMEFQAAVEEFKKKTGLTPTDIRVEIIDTTILSNMTHAFTVTQVEVSRDTFPKF